MTILFWFANSYFTKPGFTEWVVSENVQLPTNFRLDREFIYGELRQAIELAGWHMEIAKGHFVDIRLNTPQGEERTLHCVQWDGNENAVANFYWKYGADWMLPIAQKLADITQSIMTIMNESDPAGLIFVSPRDEHKS